MREYIWKIYKIENVENDMPALKQKLISFLENIKIPNKIWLWLENKIEVDEQQIRAW